MRRSSEQKPSRQPALRRRRAHRKLAARFSRNAHARSRRRIDRKRLAVERIAAYADHAEVATVDGDRGTARKEHETLLSLRQRSLERLLRGQIENLETHITPTRALRSDVMHLTGGSG